MRGVVYFQPPKWVSKSKHIVNIETYENDCFKLCILAALELPKSKTHKERPSVYKKLKRDFNFDGIEFPVQLRDIAKFEKQNKVSVNVFGIEEDGSLGVLHLCETEFDEHVNLLLLVSDDGNYFHYSLITDLSAILSNQFRNKGRGKHICNRC